MDGKLLLVTNVKDLNADEVVAQYKALADIERSFKVLKSEIEVGLSIIDCLIGFGHMRSFASSH